MATVAFTSRTVQSTDPSLSDEANRLLTGELRKVIGRDEVDVPVGRADHRSDRHAVHSKLMSAAMQIRIELLLVGTIVAMTVLIAIALNTGSSWLTGIAFVLLFPIVAFIAWSVMRLFDQAEHLGPEIAAQLSAEGVGDPDRYFNELLHDFDAVESPR